MTQQERNYSDPLDGSTEAQLVELIEEYGEKILAAASVPTRCPEGCFVEPDGQCPHGFASVLVEAGLI